MKRYAAVLACVFAATVSGCATRSEILQVNSLAPRPVEVSTPIVEGLIPGAVRNGETVVNVIYFHGMGWTQDREDGASLGRDFVGAIQRQYNIEPVQQDVKSCRPDGKSESGLPLPVRFFLSGGGVRQRTDLASRDVLVTEMGCMDRLTIKNVNGLTIHLYRVFWDNALWNAAQFAHVGFDDAVASTNGEPDHPPAARSADGGLLASLRPRNSRQFKDDLVTYGLSDAALYMSPLGRSMRQLVAAAVCVALTDASSGDGRVSTAFNQAVRIAGPEQRPVLEDGSPVKCPDVRIFSDQLAGIVFISESLGSRILFDTLKVGGDIKDPVSREPDGTEPGEAMPDEFMRSMARLSENNRLREAYLLANQIPLLGLSSLGMNRPGVVQYPGFQMVGLSEVTDFLSYELVPYFQSLYIFGCGLNGTNSLIGSADCDSSSEERRRRLDSLTQIDPNNDPRPSIVRALGFNVVDVRLRFAPVSNLLGVANPLVAHTGHMESALASQIVLCGTDGTKPLDCPK